MRILFNSGKLLLLDLASTLLFVVLEVLTHNLTVSVVVSMGFGICQIGWQLMHRRPIDTMQWVSLIIVMASGSATLITNDPRFVMVKPTLIYAGAGAAMLKRGWIDRYQPPIAMQLMPDIVIAFGYIWAGLMFTTAALNLVVALNFSVAAWGAFMLVFGIASKIGLFLLQYAAMRIIGRRRYIERAALGAMA
jgi:intracellular septation protein A